MQGRTIYKSKSLYRDYNSNHTQQYIIHLKYIEYKETINKNIKEQLLEILGGFVIVAKLRTTGRDLHLDAAIQAYYTSGAHFNQVTGDYLSTEKRVKRLGVISCLLPRPHLRLRWRFAPQKR